MNSMTRMSKLSKNVTLTFFGDVLLIKLLAVGSMQKLDVSDLMCRKGKMDINRRIERKMMNSENILNRMNKLNLIDVGIAMLIPFVMLVI